MSEDQSSISQWATETFGVPTAAKMIVERFCQEVVELDTEASYPTSLAKIQSECADCLIVLYQVATAYNFDLHTAVNNKMMVNRERKWKTEGDGVGQHID